MGRVLPSERLQIEPAQHTYAVVAYIVTSRTPPSSSAELIARTCWPGVMR